MKFIVAILNNPIINYQSGKLIQFMHIQCSCANIYSTDEVAGLVTTITIYILCELHFTILSYVPELIWLPHCTNVPLHCYIVYVWIPHECIYYSKNVQHWFHSYYHICTSYKYASQMLHMQTSWHVYWEIHWYVSIYGVTCSCNCHIDILFKLKLDILSYAFEQNIAATLHMYVQLHCYCSLHVDPM